LHFKSKYHKENEEIPSSFCLDLLTDNCHLKPYLLFCQQTLPAVA